MSTNNETIDISNLSKEERERKIKEIKDKIKQLEEQQLLKQKKQNSKPYRLAKKIGKIAKKVLLWTGISTLIMSTALTINAIASENRLTANADNINAFYAEQSVHTSYSSFTENQSLARLTVQKGKPVKFNILMDDLNNEERQDLQGSINELNSIFAVINSDYKFVLNFNPSFFDKLDPYNVDVSYMSENEANSSLSLAFYQRNLTIPSRNGEQGYGAKIKFKKNQVNKHNFTHEILHHLGLNDAYLKPEAESVPSIMHNNEPNIRTNDVALLVGKYGDYSTEEKKVELIKYIANYEQNQSWYKERIELAKQKAEYFKNTIVSSNGENNVVFDFTSIAPYSVSTNCSVENQSYSSLHFTNNALIRKTVEVDYKINNNNQLVVNKEIKSSSDPIVWVNGVAMQQNSNSQEFVFYHYYKGDIYKTTATNIVWLSTKFAKTCSEEDFEKTKNFQNKYETSNSSEIIESLIENISNDIDLNAKDFDLNEFKDSSFSFKNSTLYFQEGVDKIYLTNEKSTEKLNYFYAGPFILLGNNDIIFKTDEGFKHARLFYANSEFKFELSGLQTMLQTEISEEIEK